MTDQSKRAIHVSDLRIGSITEILQGIRLIKYFAWEEFYGSKVGGIRRPEVKALRKLSYVFYLLDGFASSWALIGRTEPS